MPSAETPWKAPAMLAGRARRSVSATPPRRPSLRSFCSPVLRLRLPSLARPLLLLFSSSLFSSLAVVSPPCRPSCAPRGGHPSFAFSGCFCVPCVLLYETESCVLDLSPITQLSIGLPQASNSLALGFLFASLLSFCSFGFD